MTNLYVTPNHMTLHWGATTTTQPRRTRMDRRRPMTTYIAGPMTGIPNFNYPLFNRVATELRAQGVDVRNPAENDGGSTDKAWDYYIRLGLQQLLECDEILLLPGWQNSRGAQLEVYIAKKLGMKVAHWGSETDQ